jgi:hypothetical protein
LVLLTQAQSATVGWTGDTGNGIALANGTPVPIGDLLELGTFNFTGTASQISMQIASFANNPTGLAAHFTLFGSTTFGNGGDPAGEWTKSSSNTGFGGEQIYIWAFNAPTLGAATQQGVFFLDSTASGTANPSWAFPSDSGSVPAGNIDIGNLTGETSSTPIQPATNTPLASAYIPVGGFGLGTSIDNGYQDFDLAVIAVPEPSSVALGLTGVALLAFRRRRS